MNRRCIRPAIHPRWSAALVLLAAGCGNPPPVPLPASSPFPTDQVHLGMTYWDLQVARPDVMLLPDTGVVEELFGGRYHYGFASNPPHRQSRLVYIAEVRYEMEGDWARREWDSLVAALAAELDLEPRCTAIDYARLRWRRAILQEEGRPVAAAVEVVGVTIGDAGPGEAELITRVWLPEYADPVSLFPEVPRAPAGRSPRWEDCEEVPGN